MVVITPAVMAAVLLAVVCPFMPALAIEALRWGVSMVARAAARRQGVRSLVPTITAAGTVFPVPAVGIHQYGVLGFPNSGLRTYPIPLVADALALGAMVVGLIPGIAWALLVVLVPTIRADYVAHAFALFFAAVRRSRASLLLASRHAISTCSL